jgi:hypothetical protein
MTIDRFPEFVPARPAPPVPSRRGGRRPGAGAPKGNLNALKHGHSLPQETGQKAPKTDKIPATPSSPPDSPASPNNANKRSNAAPPTTPPPLHGRGVPPLTVMRGPAFAPIRPFAGWSW